MNAALTEAIAGFSSKLESAKNPADLQKAITDIHRLSLKSAFEANQTGSQGAYEARDYLVGEPNTRGLSWKLNLLRRAAEANLCKMVRTGVHGGGTKILGTGDNIDATIEIYEALAAHFAGASAKAFEEFTGEHQAGEGEPAVHRAGWVNRWLVDQPNEMFDAVAEQRNKDAGGNRNLGSMLAEQASELNVFQSSLTPARAPKAPKAPKEPKAPKAPKVKKGAENGATEVEEVETISESVDSEAIPAEV